MTQHPEVLRRWGSPRPTSTTLADNGPYLVGAVCAEIGDQLVTSAQGCPTVVVKPRGSGTVVACDTAIAQRYDAVMMAQVTQ